MPARRMRRPVVSGRLSTNTTIIAQLLEVSVRSIAVPVRNAAGTAVAVMNVIVQAGRVTLRDMRTLYLPPLQAAARERSAQLVP